MTGARFVVVLLLAGAACVPPAEDPEPRGAAGFITEPSAGSRGTPFLTADGWTVQIDALAIMANVNASPTGSNDAGGSEYRYGGDQMVLFDGSKAEEIYAPKLPLGPYTVSVSPGGAYVGGHDDTSQFVNAGVPASLEERFTRVPDGPRPPLAYDYEGPAVVVVAHGAKDGAIVVVDVALRSSSGTTGGFGGPSVAVDVQANALTAGRLAVVGEALFADDGETPTFDDVAGADADHDGRASADELAAASLLAKLTARANRLFVVQ